MDSNNDINFRTLKRYDQSVESILVSATQVAVYNYVSNDWNKLEIEGALFVVSKEGTNNYGLIIINRLNTNNFNEIIDRKWEVKLNLPFLLYKNDKSDIRCVWFYDPADCKRVHKKLHEIMSNDTTTPTTNGGIDLSKLTSNTNTTTNSKPVEETLAKLGIKKIQQPTSNDKDQFLRSLIQQTNQKLVINNDSLENTQSPIIFNDKSLPNPPSTPGMLSRTLDLQELFNSSSKPSVVNNLSNSFIEKTPIKPRLDSFNEQNAGDLVLTPALLKQNGTSSDRQLSPPILSSQQPSDQLYRPTPTTQFSTNDHQFISPFQTNRPTSLSQQQTPNVPNILTMEQLKQTMIYLLQNDADFLHTIHTTYKQNVQSKFY